MLPHCSTLRPWHPPPLSLLRSTSTRCPPSGPPSPPIPIKMEPPPTGRRFFSPRAPFVSPVHARAPRLHSHHPGIHLAGFLPPEPLLRVGLCQSAAAVFPLSGERPLSFLTPKLELTSASPSRTGAAGPLSAHRPAVLVHPCPLLLARHLPGGPLKISGNTLPPLSHR
jgi:hypothetical protein